MTTISDSELHQVFQREYPVDLPRTTEGESLSEFDYDRTKAEKLAGKVWEDIPPDLLQEFFDVACFLNPRAFHYFFPAFIKQSQANIEKTSLLVDSLIGMLADVSVHWPESLKDAETKLLIENPAIAEALEAINDKELGDWSEARWQLFTEQQWALVRKWLDWINQDERWEVDRDVLRQAMKNAEAWQVKQAAILRNGRERM
jgi:hypothetical protein